MIISYKYKLVFIHIPKNAGTFVYNLLIKIDPACIDIRTDGFGHQEYNFIKKMDIFEKIKDFIFFAIIRNPFDRIISYYNFTYKLFNKNSFEDFADNNNIPISNVFYISTFNDITNGYLENYNIEKKIVLINYNNIKKELYKLFIMANIDKNIIKQYLYFFDNKINASSSTIINISNIINNKYIISKLLENKDFCKDVLFYFKMYNKIEKEYISLYNMFEKII